MTLIPALDPRLQAVLEFIQAEVHADIGSDHAHLPIRAVLGGRARRCIAVELNDGPLEHARLNIAQAVLSHRITVRQGDGFAPIKAGELDSASITGMGARTIQGILERAGESLPLTLLLQPNDSPRPLREWARANNYHLTAEALAPGFWLYPVLKLERRLGDDPAYLHLPLGAALRYGPWLLREGGMLIRQQVQADITRLMPLAAPGRTSARELAAAQAALQVLENRQ